MRHGCFVGSASIDEILIEVFQMKEHSFGFIVDRVKDIHNGLCLCTACVGFYLVL